MRFTRVYLDTNILIGAFAGDLPERIGQKFWELIGEIAPQDPAPFVSSELTLAEVLVQPMRLGLENQIQSMDNVLTSGPWLEVEPVSRNVLWGAANLRSQHKHLKLPDAIHLATAIARRCSHFLTADAGIKDSYRISVLHNNQRHPSNLVEIIRPEEATLDKLIEWQRS